MCACKSKQRGKQYISGVSSRLSWASDTKSAVDTMQLLATKYNCKADFETNNNRHAVVKGIINDLNVSGSILDFGGSGNNYWPHMDYSCLNLETCTGTTCETNKKIMNKTNCKTYNGRDLPMDHTYDVILSNFVLHHASENTVHLIRDLTKICRSYIVLGEDVSSLNASRKWQECLFKHDPNGVFRSIDEWIELFQMVEFRVIRIVGMGRVNGECDKHINTGDTGGYPGMVFFVFQKD